MAPTLIVRPFRRLPHAAWPVAVFAAGVIVSLLAWRLATNYVTRQERERFNFSVGEKVNVISCQIDSQRHILKGAAGLFDASNEVTRDEWRAYVGPIMLDKGFSSGMQGLGFALWLAPEELPEHIRRVRAEGFPEYTVRPEGNRSEYTSIIYLEPFDARNRRAFSYDMFSEPVRRAAMERARDTGQAALSGKVTLMQETDQDVQAGFLMYLPVYRRGLPTGTVAERRAALYGYVYSPFRAGDFVNALFPGGLSFACLQIFDGRETTADSLLFDNLDRARIHPHALYGITKEIVVKFEGHEWTFRFHAKPAFKTVTDRGLPWIILVGGILLSLGFGFMLWLEQKTQAKAQQLQKSEAYLSATLFSIGDGVITTDIADRVATLNAVAERLTGWMLPEARGRPVSEVFHIINEDTRQPAGMLVDDVIASGEAYEFVNHTALIAHDGNEHPIIGSVAPIRKVNGKVMGAVLVFRDITERKRMEEERKALQAQLVRSEKLAAVGELISGVAHEINNPLTGIIGLSKLLLTKPGNQFDEETKKDLESINHSSERIRKIVANLLRFARREAPATKIVSINKLLDAVLDIRTYEMKVRNVILEKQYQTDLPLIMADPSQLEQVFLNLVTNAEYAIHETRKAGGAITITTYAKKDANGEERITIEFADTGTGIPADVLLKLFNPFFTTKPVGKGTGLGLSVSYGIIKEHDGEISVRNREEGGAVFTIELPISGGAGG